MVSQASDELQKSIARFIESFRRAALRGEYQRIWDWLTPDSRILYENDFGEFRSIARRVFEKPEVREQLKACVPSGGKIIAGRVLCEFQCPAGKKLPPLILVQQGREWKIDYAFEWTTAGLGYLGAR